MMSNNAQLLLEILSTGPMPTPAFIQKTGVHYSPSFREELERDGHRIITRISTFDPHDGTSPMRCACLHLEGICHG